MSSSKQSGAHTIQYLEGGSCWETYVRVMYTIEAIV
jgi:hypothetical protein